VSLFVDQLGAAAEEFLVDALEPSFGAHAQPESASDLLDTRGGHHDNQKGVDRAEQGVEDGTSASKDVESVQDGVHHQVDGPANDDQTQKDHPVHPVQSRIEALDQPLVHAAGVFLDLFLRGLLGHLDLLISRHCDSTSGFRCLFTAGWRPEFVNGNCWRIGTKRPYLEKRSNFLQIRYF
jgi:hypothetical protein